MNKFRFLMAASLIAAVGCGDDPEPAEDVGADTTEDTGPDVTEDATPDAEPDTEPDTPVEDEICDDGEDNDGDGATDCDDSDCICPEPEDTNEACSDGIDNDLDEAVDCEDDDCAELLACTCEVPLRGGECPTEWDGSFAGPFSYIHNIQIPEPDTDAYCCFDFDGDGEIDNGLAGLLGPLALIAGDGLDIEATIEEALADDSIAILLEWGKGAEENGFWVYLGTNDTDGDGEPDQSFGDRAGGDGVFQVERDAIDEFGSLIQFNTATRDGDDIEAGPSLFRLNIPIDTEDFSLNLDLTIEQATIAGTVMDDATGVASVDEDFDIDGETITYGGWGLGGVVPLDQIGQLLNDLVAGCACAGFDPSEPIITYGEQPSGYVMECAQQPTGGCTADDGVICENVGLVCSTALPLIPTIGIADIDTDNSGFADAMSVGIRLSAVGATLADPALVPEQ